MNEFPAPPAVPHRSSTVWIEAPSVCWWEFVAIFLLVILSDYTLYSGHGYAGIAVFFFVAPLLILLGAARKRFGWATCTVMLMTGALAAKLVWCGSILAAFIGFILVGCVALSLSGGDLYVSSALRFFFGLLSFSITGLITYNMWAAKLLQKWVGIPALSQVLQFVLPAAAGVTFLGIFILANPDVVDWLITSLSELIRTIDQFLAQLIDSPWRVAFWCVTAGLSIGLLRPAVWSSRVEWLNEADLSQDAVQYDLYAAFRNTLVLLISLFAAYLLFEFWTMWTRPFPPGFHYSGYAHQGAAWLTVALGLATLVLSAIFQGQVLQDPRLPFLRKLAMLWSFENLLLAIAVYHRLFIYIGFNGMTRMRVVGLLGISTVVVGLILVVIKIRRQKRFAWVVRHQLLALAFAFYLYAVLPVDAMVMRYNVRQILASNPRPSVQIGHHETSSIGLLCLFPLLNSPDVTIRDGVAELLQTAGESRRNNPPKNWTAFQIADVRLLQKLDDHTSQFKQINPPPGALNRFREYSFQWY